MRDDDGLRVRVAFPHVAFCLAAVLVCAPALAAAQTPEAFSAALIRFANALNGGYGDEGPQITSALDSMARSLADWDRSLRALESRAAATPSGAAAGGARVHIDLGLAYVARGRRTEGLREFETAARLDGSRADATLYQGLIHDADGRASEAAKAFRAAWERDRANPVTAYWLVRAFEGPHPDRQQALDALAAAYRLVVDKQPSQKQPFPSLTLTWPAARDVPLALPAIYADGYALLSRGDYEAAIDSFRAALTEDPLLADPALRSATAAEGSAALRQGRIAIARERFQSAVAAAPKSSELHRLLGVAHLMDFELDKSIQELEVAIGLRPADERARVLLAGVLVQVGSLSRAEELLHQTIALLPRSTLAHLWLGSVYVGLNRNTDAARALETAVRSEITGQGPLYSTIGSLHASGLDFDSAIRAAANGVRHNPNDAAAHVRLARAYLDQDRRDEASAEFMAALLIDGENADAYMGIGQLHLNAGRYSDAAVALGRLVMLQPTYAEARYALANALTRAGRTDEGARELAEFQRVQQQLNERKRRLMALDVIKEEAALRYSEGAFDRAAALWQQAVDQEPGAAGNHASLAAALLAAGRPEMALQHYEKAAALGGQPNVYRQLASLYARLGRAEDSALARARYEQALLVPVANGGLR
ncbi:MAG TPA: tetratricopeptide repeat protein [Vicinamibacterales bacterium]|nr:tetratricopeptide repeat protein [Vicinamibacterales bacterium]